MLIDSLVNLYVFYQFGSIIESEPPLSLQHVVQLHNCGIWFMIMDHILDLYLDGSQLIC